jgi:peptidoglycan/LPS O-acetylase OafA/YrhL
MPASQDGSIGGRSVRIEVLRAIAALMVIGYHANGLVGGGASNSGVLSLRDNLDSGVELFFVLSGYLIALPFLRAVSGGSATPNVRSYLARRAARILPGYWLVLCIATFVVTRQPGALPSPGLLLPQFGLLQGLIPGETGAPLVVAWTLSIEALFYVGVPLVAWMLLRRRAAWSLRGLAVVVCTIWAASAATACCFATVVPDSPWTVVVLRGPAGMICQFCPGMLVALLHIRDERTGSLSFRRRTVPWGLIAAGTLGWLLVVVATGFGASALAIVVRDQACGVAFGVVLLGALALRGSGRRSTRAVARLGTVSYGLYLWHWLVFEAILASGLRIALPLPAVLDWGLSTALLGTLTLPIAVLSWRVVERPAIEWARERSTAERARAASVRRVIPPIAS